jgi:MarR family transcriptional regulator, organic hydroperoxide resistance regulator
MTAFRQQPLDRQLCFSIYGADLAINRAYKPLLDQLGLTYPQYLVLHALWETDGLTISAIAERLALEPSTITPLVKRLEAAGFLGRLRNPQDERQVRVSLTDKGRAMREESACLGEKLLKKAGMSLEELTQLNRQIQRLRDAVSAPD